MNPISALGIRIPVPSGAVVPLLAVVGIVIALAFASSAMRAIKAIEATYPRGTRATAIVVALALVSGALYLLAKVLTETLQYDPIYTGVLRVGFLEGPVIGGLAAIATMLWRFANQRWLALATGVGIGAALILKPFAWALTHKDYRGGMATWGLTDPEHLVFLIPGLVAVITALAVVRRRR